MQVDELSFAYPQRPLFSHWSASIKPGVTLVRGDESSGKSTLLKLLAGKLAADSGALQIGGIQLDEDASAYRKNVFLADPRSDAFDKITPLQYFASLKPLYAGFDDAVLGKVATSLGLLPFLEKPLYMLSTGSKRKVWLAAAFASGAALTLLDEPFGALDCVSIGVVLKLLKVAANHPSRAWVVAHYEAPAGVPLAATIDLE